MRKLFALWVLAVLASIGTHTVSAETISFDHHAVTVIDGDSIQVTGRIIQLQGIDAPELGQACDNDGHYWLCGLSAAYELRRLIGFQVSPIECARVSPDRDVTQALCMANGDDIALALISSGLAVTAADSPLHYQVAERHAREAGLGIWGRAFISPADWRQDKRLPGEHEFGLSAHLHGELPWRIEHGELTFEPRSEHAACLVKGMIENGRRIYYGPLDHEYEALRPETGRGERLFCDDDLARTAGWRRKGEETRINQSVFRSYAVILTEDIDPWDRSALQSVAALRSRYATTPRGQCPGPQGGLRRPAASLPGLPDAPHRASPSALRIVSPEAIRMTAYDRKTL